MIKDTYITEDSEIVAAKLDESAINATAQYAKEATRFDGLDLNLVSARKIKLLKLPPTLATPSDPKECEELTRIAAVIEGLYGNGKYGIGQPLSSGRSHALGD